ncbi:MAG: fumarylacetoacetate hydrolase family protein [Woeseiaceae bacterium]|nr:fumarylacetoacetate hydrolase family protein [Woeseiaceae bacterium]
MRIASFEVADRQSYGVVDGDRIHEASMALRSKYRDLRDVIAAGAVGRVAEDTGEAFGFGDVRFLPVIPDPDKILCVGVNYRPHIEEMGREVPDYPVVFVRFPGSVVGHLQPMLRPSVSGQYDFEGELAVIIGKACRAAHRDTAMDFVAGYSCFMDGSIRDWQRHTPQFTAGKNFERSGAFGPWLVTADEIDDIRKVELATRVSGELMQHASVADLVFDIPALIEYCSAFARLVPGDVIVTGTPGGVGAARTPPRWLQAGDSVEVDLGPIGTLANPVIDE